MGEPPFARIGLVGLGLIGGSIALATRAAWPATRIIGFDRPDRLAAAERRAAIHEVADVLADLRTADVIVLAVPLPALLEFLPQLACLGTHAIVTDAGSTKRQVLAAAASAGLTAFVGGHPMAGSERAGIEHARADLFAGRPWLLVEAAGGPEASARIEAFVRGLGAEPHWTDAETHDRQVAYVSHLPQLVAVALMNAAADALGDAGLSIAGPAFRDMTRLAASPPDLWQGIVSTNADFVAEALERVMANLPTLGDLQHDSWIRDAFERAGAVHGRRRSRENPPG